VGGGILLIEDCASTRALTKAALGTNHTLISVETTREAEAILMDTPIALILLDIELPDENGFQFFARLQKDERYSAIPVIFLTGRSGAADKILGFSLGAEDYIVKPIDVPVFRARIDAKMRKLTDQSQRAQVVKTGLFTVSIPKQKIYMAMETGEIELSLTVIEFKLLFLFLSHEEHVLSRAQLLREIWGDAHVTERTVDTHIYTLRRKMGKAGEFIKSEFKTGYSFSQGLGAKRKAA